MAKVKKKKTICYKNTTQQTKIRFDTQQKNWGFFNSFKACCDKKNIPYHSNQWILKLSNSIVNNYHQIFQGLAIAWSIHDLQKHKFLCRQNDRIYPSE